MVIRFKDSGDRPPAKKEVGGKTYVAEEPVPLSSTEPEQSLPFAKPVRPEKKTRKPLR